MAGEIDTPVGRAKIDERFAAIRRHVPIIYVIVLVNLFGLQLAMGNGLDIGANVPTALLVCALVRCAQWFLPKRAEISYEAKARLMRQTTWLTGSASVLICLWCLHLMHDNPDSRLAVMLFGGLTAFGTAYGLSSYLPAARMPLLALALPLALGAMLWRDAEYFGAALSLAVVALLLLRLLELHNRHLIGLIESRALIAKERERAEGASREALESATTDFLTGLSNRRAFVAAIEADLQQQDADGVLAVALVDLDRFKAMNDTFGHSAGDELLRLVARRLTDAVGESGMVARLGGDEFAIILHAFTAPAARELSQRVLTALSVPADINGRRFAVSACCGVALSRRAAADSASLLLANADIALYEAKSQTRSKLVLFEPNMAAPRRRRAQVERALQLPDLIDRIQIWFQPIVDLRTGQVLAMEALARWTDEELGEIPPAEFVPIAEQLNVIGSLGDTLISRSIDQALQWPEAIRLSVNLSAVQLSSARSASVLLRKLQESGFAAKRLQVEVTETALMADFAMARENLELLRSAGVTVVLDDFGAGYASISYLREMPFDEIKLDGSLVTAAENDEERQRLLAAVIGLCHGLGVPAVAEHIETQEQLRLLLRLGCGIGQGYCLQRPMTAKAAHELIKAGAKLSVLSSSEAHRSVA